MVTPGIPLPVSALLRRARNARGAKERHDAAYFAWEASVILAVAARGVSDATGLGRPSVGTWVSLLEAGEERTEDPDLLATHRLFAEVGHGRSATPARTSAREVLGGLAAYRNRTIGHGSVRGEEFYEEVHGVLARGLEAAWHRSHFVPQHGRLVFVESIDIDASGRRRARLLDLGGDAARLVDPSETSDVPPHLLPRRTYAWSSGTFRPLHPWVLCRAEPERECVYLFSGAGRSAAYLDYVSGATLSGPDLEAAFPGTSQEVATAVRGGAAQDTSGDATRSPATGRERASPPVGMSPVPREDGAELWIDRLAVTNAEFEDFLRSTGYAPAEKGGFLAHWGGTTTPRALRRHPVVCVSAWDAEAYAKWAGKDLPTLEEWELAARGPERRRFPWGEVFDVRRVNSREAARGGTVPVDEHPDGAAPSGCLGMAGNVHEWTASWREPDERRTRFVCGGSWATPLAAVGLTRPETRLPETRDHQTGFRCVWRRASGGS